MDCVLRAISREALAIYTTKRRFCIDFHSINDLCGNIDWPIPKIAQTLELIDSKKPKVLAKFDMTLGYFQMAFDPRICDETSFIYQNSSNSAHAAKRCAIQVMPFTMATYRFGKRFDIDTIGRCQKTTTKEYVVVIVNEFSRFVKLTPVKATSGLDATRALIDFFGTFACPRIIHSDRRTQFLNDIITSFVTESFVAFVFDIASSVRLSFGLPVR
jgi:hypothetical protein